MTPTELKALVETWPREAWPPDVTINNSGTAYVLRPLAERTFQLLDAHAALLFEAAGVRWLTANGRVVSVSKIGIGLNDRLYFGPTILHAITAAFAERGEL